MGKRSENIALSRHMWNERQPDVKADIQDCEQHLLAVADDRPPTIDHRPSIIDYRSSTTDDGRDGAEGDEGVSKPTSWVILAI